MKERRAKPEPLATADGVGVTDAGEYVSGTIRSNKT